MAVAQIGTINSFTADSIIESSPVNTNFTTIKDAFNSLVTGSNELSGGITVGGALTVDSGGFTVTAGGITITAGDLTMGTAVSQLVPGATSFSIRNNADSADNLILTNAGAATIRAGLTVTAGGITITAGGLDLTTDNITNVGTIGMGALTATTGTFSGLILQGAATQAAVEDVNGATVGPGQLHLNRDDTATVDQIIFGKNGATHTEFETSTTGFRIVNTVGGTTITGTLDVTGAITGALTGNASTATALATARAINGVDFDGTAPITVTAAAGTLTGTTLKSTVVTSSLTSVGTLASVVVTGEITANGVVDLADDVEFANATIALSGANNNVATGNVTVQRLDPGANANYTGFAGGRDGRMLILYNVDDVFTVTLNHESVSSTAANRMLMNNTADVVIRAHEGVILMYDSTASRWYVLSPSPA